MPDLSTLIDEGTRIRQTLPAEALEIFRKVLNESENNSDEEFRTKSLFNIAITYLILGDYTKSISHFQNALETDYAQKNIELQAEILRGIAFNNARKYHYKDALKFFYLSENLSIQSWNMPNLHNVYQGLASLYSKLHLYEKALTYSLKSLDIAIQSGNEEPLQTSLMSIGACYYKLGNFSDAKKYFEESLGICSNPFAESNALHFISMMKFDDENFEEAEKMALRQIEICAKNNYFDFEALGLRLLGNISFKNEKYEDALRYYEKAIKVIGEAGDRTIKFSICKYIIDTYEKMGNNENMMISLYSELYKDHVKHLQNDIHVKIEQIDLDNETELIWQEVEKEKENNLNMVKTLERVNTLNFELKQLHEEKNNLMEILAHDLKNPLQSILSSVKLMNSHDEDKTFRHELSGNIKEQSKRMFTLIKRLLDYRAIESGSICIKFTEFNSHDISEKLIRDIRISAVKKGINIIDECSSKELVIKSDMGLLYQILENLLTNAVKFSPPGSNVYLRCKSADKDIIFEIEDEGPGFTENDKKKLYSNFSKLSAQPTANEHSTGLGLSIVKKLCELLNADIRLDSGVNKGAKFIITLKKE
ncbi:MAG: tetratricopeptide repeat protein [Ignavibacteria bacterium]